MLNVDLSVDGLSNLEKILSILGENRHIQAILVVAISAVVAKISEWFLTRVLTQLTRRTRADLDDKIVEMLHRPIFNTVLLIGLGVALRLDQPPAPFHFIAFGLIKTLVVVIWLVLGARLMSLVLTWMSQHPTRFRTVQPTTFPVFEITAKVVLIGGGVYFILVSWRVDPTAWVASAGIIGIAIGFAAKDTLANLFAGVFILADAPYKVGDFIVLEGQRGQITKIGLRSTRILTRDDIEITIPNATVANSKIVNESGGPSPKHRLRIPVGVAYGSDIDQVRNVLMQVAQHDEIICTEPEPRVRFRAFGESSLDFELQCWIDNPIDRGLAQDSLNTALYKALMRSGIEIPFPQRDLHIKELPNPSLLHEESAGQRRSSD